MVEKIKVALVGLGNCFSGLIQGIEYYRQNPSQQVIGIIHDKLRDYSIHDIEFVAGFDVGANKVGKPINEAIYELPNMVDFIFPEILEWYEAKNIIEDNEFGPITNVDVNWSFLSHDLKTVSKF